MRNVTITVDSFGKAITDSTQLGYSGEHNAVQLTVLFNADDREVYSQIDFFRVVIDGVYSDKLYRDDGRFYYTLPQCCMKPPAVNCQVVGYKVTDNEPEVIIKSEVVTFEVERSEVSLYPEDTSPSLIERAMEKCDSAAETALLNARRSETAVNNAMDFADQADKTAALCCESAKQAGLHAESASESAKVLSKATYDYRNVANALRRTTRGKRGTLKDVSPLEHEVKVKMSGETEIIVAEGFGDFVEGYLEFDGVSNCLVTIADEEYLHGAYQVAIKTTDGGIHYADNLSNQDLLYVPDYKCCITGTTLTVSGKRFDFSTGAEIDTITNTFDVAEGSLISGVATYGTEGNNYLVTQIKSIFDTIETVKTVEFTQKGDTVMLDTPRDSVHMVLESGDNFTVSGTIPLVDGQDLTKLTDFGELAITPRYGYGDGTSRVDLTYTITDKVLSWVGVENLLDSPGAEPVTFSGSYVLESSGQKIIGFAQVYGLDEDNPASEYPEYDTLYTKVTVYDKSLPDIHLTVGGKNLFDVSQMAAADNVVAGRVTYDGDVITANITSGSLYVNTGKKVLLPAGIYTATLIPLTENMSVKFYAYDGSTGTQIASKNVGALDGNYSFTFKTDGVFSFCIGGSTTAYRGVYNFKVLLEQGSTSTEYEPYVEPKVYTPEADGTVKGVKSIYPSMSFITNNSNVWLDIEYNRDLIKVIENLENAIIATGGDL